MKDSDSALVPAAAETFKQPVNPRRFVSQEVTRFSRLYRANLKLREHVKSSAAATGDTWVEFTSEELVEDPQATLKLKMCEPLGITCTKDFLDKAAAAVHSSQYRSRDLIIWPKSVYDATIEMINGYPELKALYGSDLDISKAAKRWKGKSQ